VQRQAVETWDANRKGRLWRLSAKTADCIELARIGTTIYGERVCSECTATECFETEQVTSRRAVMVSSERSGGARRQALAATHSCVRVKFIPMGLLVNSRIFRMPSRSSYLYMKVIVTG